MPISNINRLNIIMGVDTQDSPDNIETPDDLTNLPTIDNLEIIHDEDNIKGKPKGQTEGESEESGQDKSEGGRGQDKPTDGQDKSEGGQGQEEEEDGDSEGKSGGQGQGQEGEEDEDSEGKSGGQVRDETLPEGGKIVDDGPTKEDQDKLDDALSEDFLKKIEDLMKNEDWNFGKVLDVNHVDIKDTPIAQLDPDSVRNQRSPEGGSYVDKIKNANTDVTRIIAEDIDGRVSKTGGSGRGSGANIMRNRIEIENQSTIDWSNILRKFLVEGSQKTIRLPYSRPLFHDPDLRYKAALSKKKGKTELPDMNIIIDTSYSMSFENLSVILGEIKNIVDTQIKRVNVLLFASDCYFAKEYKSVSSTKMNRILYDINHSWKAGGTNLDQAYLRIIAEHWEKNLTLLFTDGEVEPKDSDRMIELGAKALNQQQTVTVCTFPNKNISKSHFDEMKNNVPGKFIPVFLDDPRYFNNKNKKI